MPQRHEIQTHATESGVYVETSNASYAFPFVRGDKIRGGGKADVEGTVVYGGDSLAKHYIQSHDHEEVPGEVLQAVADAGYEVLTGVEGGWVSWEGRPDLSDTYVDISDAEAVVSPEGG